MKRTSGQYAEFWAGILCLIRDKKKTVPEDDQKEFTRSFISVMELILRDCFPSIETALQINNKPTDNKPEEQ